MNHENFERQKREGAAIRAWAKESTAMARQHAQRVIRQEVALSDDLSASFHREAQSVTLVSEHCVMLLDREETYRLLSLLEAEMKGVVS
jgi:hypothetical protein